MTILANVAVFVVALLHLGFLILEMFYWTKPLGRRTFGLSVEAANSSATLAANQGLYNGFLAAGLLWGVLTGNEEFQIFFLGCVIVAGLYGGLTVKRSILWVQAAPAANPAVERRRRRAYQSTRSMSRISSSASVVLRTRIRSSSKGRALTWSMP
jgi:putative membrane protein